MHSIQLLYYLLTCPHNECNINFRGLFWYSHYWTQDGRLASARNLKLKEYARGQSHNPLSAKLSPFCSSAWMERRSFLCPPFVGLCASQSPFSMRGCPFHSHPSMEVSVPQSCLCWLVTVPQPSQCRNRIISQPCLCGWVPMHATCCTHLIHDFITPIIFCYGWVDNSSCILSMPQAEVSNWTAAILTGVPQSLWADADLVPQISPQPLPSTSIPTHYSLIILKNI
jgi:hypothetical protein